MLTGWSCGAEGCWKTHPTLALLGVQDKCYDLGLQQLRERGDARFVLSALAARAVAVRLLQYLREEGLGTWAEALRRRFTDPGACLSSLFDTGKAPFNGMIPDGFSKAWVSAPAATIEGVKKKCAELLGAHLGEADLSWMECYRRYGSNEERAADVFRGAGGVWPRVVGVRLSNESHHAGSSLALLKVAPSYLRDLGTRGGRLFLALRQYGHLAFPSSWAAVHEAESQESRCVRTSRLWLFFHNIGSIGSLRTLPTLAGRVAPKLRMRRYDRSGVLPLVMHSLSSASSWCVGSSCGRSRAARAQWGLRRWTLPPPSGNRGDSSA